MTSSVALKRTPLYTVHKASGAKMVDFGGWDMPVQYSGILDEHNAVRNGVGLFDVSHMGEIEVRGPEVASSLSTTFRRTTPRSLKHGPGPLFRLCSTSTAGLSTTSWCTRWRMIISFCVSMLRTRKKISSTSGAQPFRCQCRIRERPVCPDCRSRARVRSRHVQKLTSRRPLSHQILLVLRRPGRTACAARIAQNRLHRRRRIRNLHCAGSSAAHLESFASSRRGIWHSSRAAWARATRCAWKRKWRSTAMRSRPPSIPLKPIWAGS